MGFWESSRGVVGGLSKILFLVDFWYLVVVSVLIISTRSMSVPSFSGLSHLSLLLVINNYHICLNCVSTTCVPDILRLNTSQWSLSNSFWELAFIPIFSVYCT